MRKLPGILLTIGWLAAGAGIAQAAEVIKPEIDQEYCSRRDADPEKCVIQDGPHRPIAKKPQKPLLPENLPAEKPPARR